VDFSKEDISPRSVVDKTPGKLISYKENSGAVEEAVLSMASIPVACYSASKVHDHVKAKYNYDESYHGQEKRKPFRHNTFEIDKVLPNYNSKLMNSIWGQYNLYASHAFQKNSEGSVGVKAVDFFHFPQVKNLWDSLHTTH